MLSHLDDSCTRSQDAHIQGLTFTLELGSSHLSIARTAVTHFGVGDFVVDLEYL